MQAGQFRTCCGEAFGRNAQLLRVRPVLGVMNGDDLAGTEAQGIVEGAWLGPRPAFGDEHDAVFVIKAERLSCGDGLLVIGLERQPYFQPVGGIVDRLQGREAAGRSGRRTANPPVRPGD